MLADAKEEGAVRASKGGGRVLAHDRRARCHARMPMTGEASLLGAHNPAMLPRPRDCMMPHAVLTKYARPLAISVPMRITCIGAGAAPHALEDRRRGRACFSTRAGRARAQTNTTDTVLQGSSTGRWQAKRSCPCLGACLFERQGVLIVLDQGVEAVRHVLQHQEGGGRHKVGAVALDHVGVVAQR